MTKTEACSHKNAYKAPMDLTQWSCPDCGAQLDLSDPSNLRIETYPDGRVVTVPLSGDARPTVPEGLVESIAQFVQNWNGETRDGDTFLIADEIREKFATLSPASHDSRLADDEMVIRAADAYRKAVWDKPGGTIYDFLRAALDAALRSTPAPDALPEADLAACERAIDRMGWDEIRAFMNEPGQSPYEDAGGYLLRKIKTLFGIKPDRLETYREAARRLVAEARTEGKPS